MATYGLRNIYAETENQVLKGKAKAQPEVKRAVLKEVGNKVLAQPHGKKEVQEKKPETLQTVICANVKQPAKKQPSILVKETRACRLRTQHSRQSIYKIPEKKSDIVLEKEESAAKQNSKPPRPAGAVDALRNHRPGLAQSKVDKPRALQTTKATTISTSTTTATTTTTTTATTTTTTTTTAITTNTIKPDSVQEEALKVDLTKLEVSKRHNAPGAFSSTLLDCAHVIDIDKDDENDPIMLGMYAKDMYKYIREMEVKFPISPQYLKNSSLSGKMRATLIDWLVEVHREFELNTETLFLTVAIIDRYLEKHPDTSRNELQLVGLTAMFIAFKYEETYIPDIRELVYVADNAYTKNEILKMEIKMVKSLDCSFGRPLPIHFLRRYSKADRVSPVVHVMAKYIMEIGILEYDFCHVAPSLLAAAALFISLWLLSRKKNVWSQNLVQYSNYSEGEILPLVKKLSAVLLHAASSKHKGVFKKYSQQKNLQVSVLPVMNTLADLIKN